MTAPFDPGLQPERTALAWRRTALSVIVGSVVGARLLAPDAGAVALGLAVVGLAGGSLLLSASARRRRRVDASLRERGDLSAGPGGAALAVLAVTGAACGVLAALAVALTALR